MITNAVVKGANEVVTTYSYGTTTKKLQQQGMKDEQVSATLSIIPFTSRTLYNPTYDYVDFLVTGMAGTTLQQVMFMAVGMAVAREKEERTWSRFAVWKRSPWKIMFVKMFPYWLIGILNVFVVMAILTSVYELSFRGSAWSILLIAVVFSFTVASVGYLLSLIAPNKITALQISMLVALPSFSLSGHSWPMEAMPKFLQVIAHGLPLTYFLEAVRAVMLEGANDRPSFEGLHSDRFDRFDHIAGVAALFPVCIVQTYCGSRCGPGAGAAGSGVRGILAAPGNGGPNDDNANVGCTMHGRP